MSLETINALFGISGVHPALLALLIIWSLVWKGLALWKSASLRQKWWFVILLVVNTAGILEIIYYFFVSRNYKVEVIEEK